jgi:hypothetical protein
MAGRQGELKLAEGYLKESLSIHRDLEDIRGIALCLANLAQVALHDGQVEKFVWLYGATQQLRQSIGANMQADEGEGFENNLASARQQLGADRFEQVWLAGQLLDLEQVIDKVMNKASPY